MLFKNHSSEPFKLTAEQQKEVKNVFGGKFPVTVRWVPEKTKRSTTNKIPDEPAGTIISLTWPVKEKDGSNIYTYALNVRPEIQNNIRTNVYIPNEIIFTGLVQYGEDDLELLWFLWYCYPSFRGGKNNIGGSSTDEIMFDLPHLARVLNVEYESLQFQAKKLIMDPDHGLTEGQLLSVCRALFIPNVENMSKVDSQDALLKYINKGVTVKQKSEVLNYFLAIAGNEDITHTRSVVQEALDKGHITYDPGKREYYMQMDGKPEYPALCKIPANREPKEFLCEVMAGTREGIEKIKILEATLNQKEVVKEAKKKKGED